MLDSIFSVKPEHLTRLTPDRAVDAFRQLLWAEATVLGINAALINVPTAITVADGGIDAQVRDAVIPAGDGQGIIRNGLTRYQIKTGDFGITNRNIKDLLFNSKEKIKPRIKSCLDQNGTLIIVLFGWDDPERVDNEIISKAIEKLKEIDSGYTNAKIEVVQQNQLIGLLQKHPSLSLHINERSNVHFQSHKSWSRDTTMKLPLQLGNEQRSFVNNLRQELTKSGSEATHIRIYGEAGIGKTRLVFEATAAEYLSPLVLYCSSAETFIGSDLMNELLREDNSFFALLVVDECNATKMSEIIRWLKHNGRLRLVTIFNESESISGVNYLEVPSLKEEQTKAIIMSYGALQDQADRFADLCGGSPRFAHCIGENLKQNPGNPLHPVATDADIYQRIIAGANALDDPEIKLRYTILCHIALFKRFGYTPPLDEEARAISKIVETVDPNITWSKFQEIVGILRNRKILQGESTLYISPKALHIWLWAEWWRHYGSHFDMETFLNSLPVHSSLAAWFYEMFRYAAQSYAAPALVIVRKLLGPQGVFTDE